MWWHRPGHAGGTPRRPRLPPSCPQRGRAPEVPGSLPSCPRAWPEVAARPTLLRPLLLPLHTLFPGRGGRLPAARSRPQAPTPTPPAPPARAQAPSHLAVRKLNGSPTRPCVTTCSSAGLTALDAPATCAVNPKSSFPRAPGAPHSSPAQARGRPQVWSEERVPLSGLHLTFSLPKGADMNSLEHSSRSFSCSEALKAFAEPAELVPPPHPQRTSEA